MPIHRSFCQFSFRVIAILGWILTTNWLPIQSLPIQSLPIQSLLAQTDASGRSDAQALADPANSTATENSIPFLIGGYGPGLYASSLDYESLAMAEPELLVELANPSFFCMHPKLRVVYCVSEVNRNSPDGAQITAVQLSEDRLRASVISSQSIDGDGPCHVSLDALGKYAFVANYGSGCIGVFPLDEQGNIGAQVCKIQHEGSSINPRRQTKPHAHSIWIDPSGQFVLAADLGTDAIHVYRFDSDSGQLEPHDIFSMPAGSGPRHMAFHPNGRQLFVILELSSQLASLSWNAEEGELQSLDLVSTLPSDYSGNNSTAEVLVHPNGKFVYGSNRGHNSIAAFSIGENGKLKLVGTAGSGGETPRNFRLNPTGTILLAENQNSDTVCALRVDIETGLLTPTDQFLQVPKPACIKFLSW